MTPVRQIPPPTGTTNAEWKWLSNRYVLTIETISETEPLPELSIAKSIKLKLPEGTCQIDSFAISMVTDREGTQLDPLQYAHLFKLESDGTFKLLNYTEVFSHYLVFVQVTVARKVHRIAGNLIDITITQNSSPPVRKRANRRPSLLLSNQDQTKLSYEVTQDRAKDKSIQLPLSFDPDGDDVTISFEGMPNLLHYNKELNLIELGNEAQEKETVFDFKMILEDSRGLKNTYDVHI